MMFFSKGKLEKTIINPLKHQIFYNIVEVLKYQKEKIEVYDLSSK